MKAMKFQHQDGLRLEWDQIPPLLKWVKSSFLSTYLIQVNNLMAHYRKFDSRKFHFSNIFSPPCDEYKIEINILGMRNLQSEGILPVKKPFIKFNLKSLLPPSLASAIDNIVTNPHDGGSNPTISTVIKFNIHLPTDPLYCPSLTCGVYDYIFKGISQPILGNFVLDIGKLMIQNKEARI